MKMPIRWKRAIIASDDALILPQRANPNGWHFWERQVSHVSHETGATVVDEERWRSGEPHKPSRSEAIRWLIGQGLQVELKQDPK